MGLGPGASGPHAILLITDSAVISQPRWNGAGPAPSRPSHRHGVFRLLTKDSPPLHAILEVCGQDPRIPTFLPFGISVAGCPFPMGPLLTSPGTEMPHPFHRYWALWWGVKPVTAAHPAQRKLSLKELVSMPFSKTRRKTSQFIWTRIRLQI